MRVVRLGVLVATAVVTVAVVVLAVRSASIHLPGLGRHPSAVVAQAATPVKETSPAPPARTTLSPREIVRRMAAARPTLLGAAALAGWVLSLLLALLLLRLVGRWRTAFENKEWLLVPSGQASQLQAALLALAQTTGNQLERVSERVAAAGDDVRTSTAAIQETRAEFSILRDELDSKTREVAALRLGQEFHVRRPVLMRVIRALDIIDDDLTNQRDIRQTVEGVRVELRECLEDNAIFIHTPTPGTRLSEAKGVDAQGARQEPTQDEALWGTIASTDRPAYVARGPQGAEEVLVPAKVRVFV